jgi:hypothetical protein
MTVPIGRLSLSFGFLVMFVSCTWLRSCFQEVPCLRGGINCTGARVVLVLSLKVLVKGVQSTCWSICRFWVLCLSSEFLFRVVQSTCWSLCRFWVLCLRIERRLYLVRRLAGLRVCLGDARLSSWCCGQQNMFFLTCHPFVPIQEVAGANQSW